jgi:hypothetical protein
MRIKASLVVVGLIACAGLVRGEERHDGYFWLKLSGDQKVFWVGGFYDGVLIQKAQGIGGCSNEIATTSGSDICGKLGSYLDVYDAPQSATYGQIVDGVDHFYRDYRNKSIPLYSAVLYVNQELNGTPQSVIDERIRQFRDQS